MLSSLHVVTSDRRRGAEIFAADLVSKLCQRGGDARLFALHQSGSPGALEVPALGPSRRSHSTIRALRRHALAADVVVAHGSSTLEACAIGLSRHPTPFIYRTIGEPAYWAGTAWHRKLIGSFLRRATRNVVLYSAAGDQLVKLYRINPSSLDIIPNAVHQRTERTSSTALALRRSAGVPDSSPCLAFVGALSAEKDVPTLVRAVARIGDLHLLIAGDGAERERTERLGSMLAPGRVHHLGVVQDPSDVYLAADLLALPSRSEGLPGVVIEAGLLGVPTIASAVGGVPELIEHDRTGFLVLPGDPSLFATEISRALPKSEPVGRQAAKTFSMRFTIDRVVQQWETSMLRAVRPD